MTLYISTVNSHALRHFKLKEALINRKKTSKYAVPMYVLIHKGIFEFKSLIYCVRTFLHVSTIFLKPLHRSLVRAILFLLCLYFYTFHFQVVPNNIISTH